MLDEPGVLIVPTSDTVQLDYEWTTPERDTRVERVLICGEEMGLADLVEQAVAWAALDVHRYAVYPRRIVATSGDARAFLTWRRDGYEYGRGICGPPRLRPGLIFQSIPGRERISITPE